MIKIPTTFILGAGSSAEFGFPLGYPLMVRLWQDVVTPGGWLTNLMEAAKFTESDRQRFATDLRDSGLQSIDDFLERADDGQRTLGKFAITATLLNHEDSSKLVRGTQGPSWFDYLFDKMASGAREWKHFVPGNNTRFITYNYDRSLEQLFSRSIRGTYGLSERKSREVVEDIPITHVHGSFIEHEHDTLAYGEVVSPGDPTRLKLDAEIVTTAASNIALVSEADVPSYEDARRYLQESERIVFLGFGYHASNIKRLMVSKMLGERQATIYGTVFRLKNAEVAAVEELLERPITTADLKCLEMLREHVVL